MINEKILEEALRAISTLNREVGGIQIAIEWIKSLIFWQMWVLGFILISSVTNVILTRRNGRR